MRPDPEQGHRTASIWPIFARLTPLSEFEVTERTTSAKRMLGTNDGEERCETDQEENQNRSLTPHSIIVDPPQQRQGTGEP
ncbi:hypothetical protein [Tuwongella immobilis]|uniref:Uncharacterized protein n=1 Tax=Tuwongella immobilis TaxID=692036 RepID=A0A6C2YTR1_9BACT|nr:hypothetical protein [Tuwongella immobilis]VIP04737.1 unnamed protein product [Tuwongella immobilis]VTS06833.1 unnamed protein product [Tuwongella immobilis]